MKTIGNAPKTPLSWIFLKTNLLACCTPKKYRSYCCMVPPQKNFFGEISTFSRGGDHTRFFQFFFSKQKHDRFLHAKNFLHIFTFLAGNAPKTCPFCVRSKNAIKKSCFLGRFSFKMYKMHTFSPPQAKNFENRKKMYHFQSIFTQFSAFGGKFFQFCTVNDEGL